ncbi:hypothetical protein ACQCT5_10410 [Sutcliffiella halmapala]
MVLLNYIELLFLAVFISFVTAMYWQLYDRCKSHRKTIVLILKAFIVLPYFPIFQYKKILRYKTDIIKDINKDKDLTFEDKKKLKKLLSSKTNLFFRILWRDFLNLRVIIEAYVNVSCEVDTLQKITPKIMGVNEHSLFTGLINIVLPILKKIFNVTNQKIIKQMS